MDLRSVPIIKYPRTRHLEGSRLQKGDEDLSQVPYRDLVGRHIVVEEKMDGANCGVRFLPDATLLLQSRGHALLGGGRERHFALLKSWAAAHEDALLDVLGDRYGMYGEWMAAKHTVFYDRLPHYFLEFDLLDLSSQAFLSTAARRRVLAGTPVVSVPVLYEGPAPRRQEDLLSLVVASKAKSTNWRAALREEAVRQGISVERVTAETENSDLSEGLYIKVEEDDRVVDRLKWVRQDFLQALVDADGHWQSRPILPNRLAPGVDLFAPSPTSWADIATALAADRAASTSG